MGDMRALQALQEKKKAKETSSKGLSAFTKSIEVNLAKSPRKDAAEETPSTPVVLNLPTSKPAAAMPRAPSRNIETGSTRNLHPQNSQDLSILGSPRSGVSDQSASDKETDPSVKKKGKRGKKASPRIKLDRTNSKQSQGSNSLDPTASMDTALASFDSDSKYT